MSKKLSCHKKHVIYFCIAFFFILAIILFLIFLPTFKIIQRDYLRISSEEYDTVFLSMFPTDNYDEADFNYYRGGNTLITSHCIMSVSGLRTYLQEITQSGNEVSTVYLGVIPNKLSSEKLLALIREYPGIHFHVILAHPSIDYWRELSASKRNTILGNYQELSGQIVFESNVSIYSFLQEWVLLNPDNYQDTFLTSIDTSRTIFLHCIDHTQESYLTPGNVDTFFAEAYLLLERECSTPTSYPDLSEYEVVFFGDSVIGNYTDSTSIPGVVAGLTNANVYNCGFGANSAAHVNGSQINLPEVVDAFLTSDTSPLPTNKPVYSGINEYWQNTTETTHTCFVINYGLNDYYTGVPVSTQNPYDTNSYIGAFRTSIEALQKAYPEAQIILTTPNFTSYFNNGEDHMSEVGGTLTDYVNAIKALGTEYQIDVIDNYSELDINATNHVSYLLDGCHPNQRTRFTMGSRIALTIR